MADKPAGNVVENPDAAGWDTVVEPYGDTFPFENEGDTLTGEYLSSKEVEQDDMNTPGEKRMANVYEIVDTNGQKWSVWDSYSIKLAFDKIEIGTTVRIIYHGKVQLDGGRSVKKFTVQTKSS